MSILKLQKLVKLLICTSAYIKCIIYGCPACILQKCVLCEIFYFSGGGAADVHT